jgi:alkaline phosphatase
VLFGGGAENFYNSTLNGVTYLDRDQYAQFKSKDYKVAMDNTELQKLPSTSKALGVFSVSNLAKWVDRNVLKQNLRNQNNSADGLKKDALDQPGLKDMTLKAIDIVSARSKVSGWFIMSEAASIDKMLHVLDYDRALGELLELDDTVRATIEHLNKTGQLEDTLIIVTGEWHLSSIYICKLTVRFKPTTGMDSMLLDRSTLNILMPKKTPAPSAMPSASIKTLDSPNT